jgi:hypothetical protein
MHARSNPARRTLSAPHRGAIKIAVIMVLSAHNSADHDPQTMIIAVDDVLSRAVT